MPLFYHTGNPYVWLDFEYPAYKPVAIWPHQAFEPCEWENAPSYQAMLEWTSWMYNEPRDTMSVSIRSHLASSSWLAKRTLSHILSQASFIAQGRQRSNIECGYRESQEWRMLDDPMRNIAVALPTWHNSVHPLAELAFLPLLPTTMSHYLSCRLACWQRDTFTTDQWTETGESPLTQRPKLDANYCLAIEASSKIDTDSIA